MPGSSPPDPRESDWVAGCLRGDLSKFQLIVERHQGRIFSIALRMLRSRVEAEDVAQDTFLRAYASLSRYDAARPLGTWLCRIAVNACVDRLRKKREALSAEPLDPPTPATALEDLQRSETGAALQRALMELPVDYRTVLVLKDIEDLDYESIAAILGGSIGALKIRVVRARAKLAELLRVSAPDLVPEE
jgi:RNA polymerase sigma-70 factor, ECF subfamily